MGQNLVDMNFPRELALKEESDKDGKKMFLWVGYT